MSVIIASHCDSRTGRLTVERESDALHFLPWPAMLAFRRAGRDGEWVGDRPEFSFLAHANDAAIEQFCALIPDRALLAVRPFPSHHWHLLLWMARAGEAGEDLAFGNPALAFMLASAAEFDRMRDPSGHLRSWAYLLSRKQVRSLDRLGFPSAEQIVRILRKIAHTALTIDRLKALRGQLRCSEVAKRLSHLPRINATVLEIAATGVAAYAAPRLLHALATEARHDADVVEAQTLIDTIRMWRQLHRGRPAPVFHSLRRLQAEHETLVGELNAVPESSRGPTFPLPPLAGTLEIVPIANAEELVAEGREQHNCVASLARRIRHASIAVYRVLAPERCTLSLVRKNRTWRIDQLKAACNRPPRRETREVVASWFRQQGGM